MPSNLALASTFDVALAREQGEAVGAEARARGFSVLLGGTANLIRNPLGGRNFEYFSEDPLLTGLMAGAEIAGAQSLGLISTIKHYALNDQETGRMVLDAKIAPEAARESDLLAFELAIERGRPLSVMCAYNKVDGVYSCENDWLINQVLKGDWHYPGFVMSDWGAVHSTVKAALAGLDQESGDQLDRSPYFGKALADAVADGEIPMSRLDDMAGRVLRSIYASGLADASPRPVADEDKSDETAERIEREGMVLLKNDGVLPLPSRRLRIAVFGAHADKGVLTGGGSSQVLSRGAFKAPVLDLRGAPIYAPSPPLAALRRRFPGDDISFSDGTSLEAARKTSAAADVAIVFAEQWMTETADAPDLLLPQGQNELIEAVAGANPKTIVVLETGGPVLMPWLDKVSGVLEAWYGGQRGGEAIAAIFSGDENPSGRLPVTFPASALQLPAPKIEGDPKAAPVGPPGRGREYHASFSVDYAEGAAVGYKAFALTNEKPLFPFGFGLSYTTFGLDALSANVAGDKVTAELTVENRGARAGAAAPQIYVTPPGGLRACLRLAGFERIELAPGEHKTVSLEIDPRLIASFDEGARVWRIAAGSYRIEAGFDAESRPLSAAVTLPAATLPP